MKRYLYGLATGLLLTSTLAWAAFVSTPVNVSSTAAWDGTTDDSAAWNTLIAAGEAIIAPQGASRLSVTIGTPSPGIQKIRIQGAGRYATILRQLGLSSKILTTVPNADLTLMDVKLEAVAGGGVPLLWMKSKGAVERVNIDGGLFNVDGARYESTNSNVLADSLLQNAGNTSRALWLIDHTAGLFRHNRYVYSGRAGIEIQGAQSVGNLIDGGIIDSNGWGATAIGGLLIAATATQNRASGLYFESNTPYQAWFAGNENALSDSSFHGTEQTYDVYFQGARNIGVNLLGSAKPSRLEGSQHVLLGAIVGSLQDASADSTILGVRLAGGGLVPAQIAEEATFLRDVYLKINGVKKRIEVGPENQCGQGYRCLRVAN